MTPQDIYSQLQAQFAERILTFHEKNVDPYIVVEAAAIHDVSHYLRHDPDLQFDSLMCLSGVDYGPDKTLGVVYHLHSTTLRHKITLKVEVPREPMALCQRFVIFGVRRIGMNAKRTTCLACALPTIRIIDVSSYRTIGKAIHSSKTIRCRNFTRAFVCPMWVIRPTSVWMSTVTKIKKSQPKRKPIVCGNILSTSGKALSRH